MDNASQIWLDHALRLFNYNHYELSILFAYVSIRLQDLEKERFSEALQRWHQELLSNELTAIASRRRNGELKYATCAGKKAPYPAHSFMQEFAVRITALRIPSSAFHLGLETQRFSSTLIRHRHISLDSPNEHDNRFNRMARPVRDVRKAQSGRTR
ncbi:hypothetical protein SCHPADRAFT_892720 [Schizopora paradoxa]|uniref:Uncharacterized protein n=1 Tax=Schizopora paradoxa TaxID=27342 RepID=A0A0H2RKK6_9AGAM|nr:hypothetical protein SCHPADRAFT_892720 [Schizopora paradoxa]